MRRWYEEGLRFECTRCGNCCTGAPGYVWVTEREQFAIAGRLGLPLEEFQLHFTKLVGRRLSLLERPNGDCVFLDREGGCGIQAVKPRQCVAFPFWPRILASRKNWRQTAVDCPGIGQGPRYEADEIDVMLDMTNPRDVLCRILPKANRTSA